MIKVGRGMVPITTPPYASGVMYRDGQNGKTVVIDPNTNTRNDFYDPVIELDTEVIEILIWAGRKMVMEKELNKQIENNPAVQEAYNNLQLLLTLSR